MNNELKPCPFCGGTKVKIDCKTIGSRETYSVRCNKCHARGGTYGITIRKSQMSYEAIVQCRDSAKQKALEEWNTRKPMDEIVEQLEEVKDNAWQCAFEQERIKTDMQLAIAIVKGGAK